MRRLVPDPCVWREIANISVRIARSLINTVPGGFFIGEDGDEGLLAFKDPGKRDQEDLRELNPTKAS